MNLLNESPVLGQGERTKVVECRSVWKFFGESGPKSQEAAKSGQYSKEELLSKFGCVVAVADATFDVYEGETFCIMGLSGSGKSTLIRHLNRLIEPSTGEVLVQGQDVCKMDPATLRAFRANQIAMVFQHVALLPYRTVLENVALPLEVRAVKKDERNRICRKALDTVGLTNWADRYPGELSGGMQQRVGIARALASDPKILLMDEPFSALDPLIRKQLQVEFKQLSTELKKTSVFITHDLEEAIRIGDRIAIMKEGKIVQIGTPEDIVLNPADDYVAEFVDGISRLHLVKAHSFMVPVSSEEDLAKCPVAKPDDSLQVLIDLSLEHKAEKISIQEAGHTVGVVTRQNLLQAVRGVNVD